jgi:hypothetical protein
MKRSDAFAIAAALLGALAISSPASAFGGGHGGGGWHGGGGGWHGGGGGWHGGGWHGGGWNGGWGVGAGLVGLGIGAGLASGAYGYPYDYGYYPGYATDYGSYPGYATTAPLVTGRSVATGGIGEFCSTPVKTCQLIQPSYVGAGCSCRVPGGRASGSVTP